MDWLLWHPGIEAMREIMKVVEANPRVRCAIGSLEKVSSRFQGGSIPVISYENKEKIDEYFRSK